MKLPVDLSTETTSRVDQIERNSGSVLICTVTGNFMPSLGQMSNKEIVMNVAVLGILVVTIFVNLVACTISSALCVASSKKYIDLNYSKAHKTFSTEEWDITKKFNFDELKEYVTKYWVMAKTNRPQFLVARSATCIALEVICVFIAVILILIELVTLS